jgi:hypothetical protein
MIRQVELPLMPQSWPKLMPRKSREPDCLLSDLFARPVELHLEQNDRRSPRLGVLGTDRRIESGIVPIAIPLVDQFVIRSEQGRRLPLDFGARGGGEMSTGDGGDVNGQQDRDKDLEWN